MKTTKEMTEVTQTYLNGERIDKESDEKMNAYVDKNGIVIFANGSELHIYI